MITNVKSEFAVVCDPIVCSYLRVHKEQDLIIHRIAVKTDLCRKDALCARCIIDRTDSDRAELCTASTVENNAVDGIWVRGAVLSVDNNVTDRDFTFKAFTACLSIDYSGQPIKVVGIIKSAA